ncbi:MAG: hypothetical protein H7125_02560 [Proteobacteria bacterium]|nr:hypothetical protein [Burkholderiales bacterium]
MRPTTLALFTAACFATGVVSPAVAQPATDGTRSPAAVVDPANPSQIPASPTGATTRSTTPSFTTAQVGTDSAMRSGAMNDRVREPGMSHWFSMPFPLVLWLLLAPLVFAIATKGSAPVGSMRNDGRPDLRPGTTTGSIPVR